MVLITSTKAGRPAEWNDPSFWRAWATVYIGTDAGDSGDAVALRPHRPKKQAIVAEHRHGRQVLLAFEVAQWPEEGDLLDARLCSGTCSA